MKYFQESPVPVDPSMFPTWPAKSEQPRRTHGNSPKPPSGGKAFSKLLVSMMFSRRQSHACAVDIYTDMQQIYFQNSFTLPVDQRYRKKYDMLTDFNSCIILNFRVMMIHVAQSSGGFHLGTATKGASAAGAGFALKFGP